MGECAESDMDRNSNTHRLHGLSPVFVLALVKYWDSILWLLMSALSFTFTGANVDPIFLIS